MGYVSYTAANTSGAQSFSDAMTEINTFNAELVKDMGIIANNNASVIDKVNAYQFLSDFQSGGGPYANIVGTKIAALKTTLLTDVDRQLNDQLISMPTCTDPGVAGDNNGGSAQVYVNGHPATALDIVQNWNKPDVVFSFSWQNTEGARGSKCDHDTNVPWCSQPLNDLTDTGGQSGASNWHAQNSDHHGTVTDETYIDANGKPQQIPGGGIQVDMTHVMSNCQNHYDITASGSAQALAGFTLTTFLPDPGYNFRDSVDQAISNAGLAVPPQ